MRVPVYSVKEDSVGLWEEDGYVQLEDGNLSLEDVADERAKYRAQIYINENIDNEDKEAFLQNLSSVFFVPFCRFGDIIEESLDTNEKEEDDETEGISDEDDTEEAE
jgi:hypothetical protein